MADKTEKIDVEREYIIPLREEWLKVPEFKRVPKAVKAIKQFLVRHMKIYDKDLRKIKLDRYLNQELWHRGIRNPPAKIKVRVKKMKIEGEDIVRVELVNIPERIKFQMEREKRLSEKVKKVEKKEVKEEVKTAEEKVEEEKQETEKQEKKDSTVEAGLKLQDAQAKQAKHIVKDNKIKKVPLARKALQK